MGTLVCTKFNIDYNDISLTTLLQNKQSGTAPVLSENQVYPDYSLSFCQLSMSMASRRFKIVPSLASKCKYTQDKAKTCNCSQVNGIGEWEGWVGRWESGRVAKSGATSWKLTEAWNVPAMIWGLEFRTIQAMPWLSKAFLNNNINN